MFFRYVRIFKKKFVFLSTTAALEIFALDLTSGDREMPVKGTLSSEHRSVILIPVLYCRTQNNI